MKRIQDLVEKDDEVVTRIEKPHQVLLGSNYGSITEFACQWCLHKNSKVRKVALKLIVEICRMNSIDSNGGPFKQRILNYLLGLRASIRVRFA